MNRRDLLLQQMNIDQWVLTKPQVLKGDAQIRLAGDIKFVVVCEEDQQKSQLFQDILHTLQLTSKEYQWLNEEQAHRLIFQHQPIFLLILSDEQAVRLRKKLTNQIAWHYPSWQSLQQPETKRHFWQQIEPICTHFEENL
ncbi:DNA polymerase III subunit psi [Vespertiliibacter pulmonis]|uniref:DNA polymerase III subunit psi n=1 Tax=Vespertiliibacter pulmonis TaxID=1443036 RepID=A0A3N4VKU3_9PAST|nr:DNA polymerase III subunit psi [Vespertiliibacter pulmonis]QLB21179.1 DNA polymerase III subunit psi [Vespertiliibacter pulmonis]RPE83712.1 DNA polymerase III psi subunit [Vespertiliibacter pulmonis]